MPRPKRPETTEKYLVPDTKHKELVVLTDNILNVAILASTENTLVLTSVAADILRNCIFGSPQQPLDKRGSPLHLGEAVKGGPEQRASAMSWLQDLVDDGWFQFSNTAPAVKVAGQERLLSGRHIPARGFRRGKGVPVEFDGTLITATINRTKLYWHFSDISIRERLAVVDMGEAASVGNYGPFGATLYPKPAAIRGGGGGGTLGANCNVCKVCGACGACGACALCGGVDFAVAAEALVALDAGLTLVNAVSVFEQLRENPGE